MYGTIGDRSVFFLGFCAARRAAKGKGGGGGVYRYVSHA